MMGKTSDKEKENIILKAVEAIQESINQIQVNPDFYLGKFGLDPTVGSQPFGSENLGAWEISASLISPSSP